MIPSTRDGSAIEHLRAQGLEPVGSTPEPAATPIRNDVARRTNVARDDAMRSG